MLAVAAVLAPLAVGLRVAGSVAGERDRQTLDALLMLPGDRRGVLWAKLTAAAEWARGLFGLAAGVLVGSVLVGGVGVVTGLLAVAHILAATAAAVGLAGWLTVRERTAARATVLFLIAMLTVNVAPFVAAPLADLLGPGAGGLIRSVSPGAAVWSAGRRDWLSVAALVPSAAFAAGGWLLWRSAERRLEHGGR
jgi:ABC-type Na+ efflux pump permease subunit